MTRFPRHLNLADQHTPAAIRTRIAAATEHSYLGDFVLGAIDGAVTTFAVVAGVAGAELSSGVAVVLGLANLLADGFSMAASNYLSSKANRDVVEHARRVEEMHIDEIPEGEREEIRQIFAGKGFDGGLLEQIVEVITQDRHRWVDTMLTDELGLQLDPPSPWKAAITTFAAFALAGMIPLLPIFLFDGDVGGRTFVASSTLTGTAFFLIGVAKARVVQQSWLRSGLETFLIGGAAAGLAFLVGWLLRGLGGA